MYLSAGTGKTQENFSVTIICIPAGIRSPHFRTPLEPTCSMTATDEMFCAAIESGYSLLLARQTLSGTRVTFKMFRPLIPYLKTHKHAITVPNVLRGCATQTLILWKGNWQVFTTCTVQTVGDYNAWLHAINEDILAFILTNTCTTPLSSYIPLHMFRLLIIIILNKF
jgi:hypothetical protein